MKYVIGIDIGTSSVKAILAGSNGQVYDEVSLAYPLIQPQPGYSEQDPEWWVTKTIEAIKQLIKQSNINQMQIEGISFSGQMHSLVILDEKYEVLHPAILWNDTRTSSECRLITESLGDKLWQITKNQALEGFTLPKLLWMKKHKSEIFDKASIFLLPKDYVRFCLTGQLAMDYSDAAGTLLLDVENKKWSNEILSIFEIPEEICPSLVESIDFTGFLLPEVAKECGLHNNVKTYAGGADNACGAIGAGVLNKEDTLCSIGTSGVVLSPETEINANENLHFFYHSKPDTFYKMGVTLAAGHSLSWFRNSFAPNSSFEELLADISSLPVGSGGLLFTPYISGERTPHADSSIRGSFIGIDSSHQFNHFARAVLEGITFSLRDSFELIHRSNKKTKNVISIGGGSKNKEWMQMQADIFQTKVTKLEHDHGPALGAAIIASIGLGWFLNFEEGCHQFIRQEQVYEPIDKNVQKYDHIFAIYQQIYKNTKDLSKQLTELGNTSN